MVRRLARGRLAGPLALAVALLALAPAAIPAAALQLTTFSDGSSSKTVVFQAGGGTDTSVALSLPKDSYEISATLSVRGGADPSGHYPSNPAVFVQSASNTTQVYGFSGQGYGAMGLQTLLSTGGESFALQFTGASSDASHAVLLPQGATVTSAGLTLTGAAVDGGFTGPDTLNAQVGGNSVQVDTAARGAPYLVDIDGDGDLDLFVGGGNFSVWTEPYAGGPRFFRNTGNATAWKFQEEPSVLRRVAQGYGFSPALADLNGDGLPDLLTVGGPFTGVVRFYWNNGSLSAPSWQPNNSVFSGITVDPRAHAAFADLDADGDFDLIIGDESGALTYFKNTGNATAPQWTSTSLFSGINVGANAAPSFGDYDQDGDLDLVIGNGTSGQLGDTGGTTVIKYFENKGNRTAPSFSSTDKLAGLHVGGSYTGTNAVPFLADLDADGDLDLIVGDVDGKYWLYTGSRSFPHGVALDIGNDGTAEWSRSGALQGSASASGLASAFQTAVANGAPGAADAFGNKMVSVHLKVSSDSAGAVTVGSVSIAYTYSALTTDFAVLLNRVRLGTPADTTGQVSVALPVSASSAGNVTLESLSVSIDLPPSVTPPGLLTLNEDTKSDNLLDLTTVFADDFTPASQLNFTVTANSAAGIVDVYITAGGRYLGADAATGGANDNWNGFLNATVTARDSRGLLATAVIAIEVLPVNDPPVILNVLPSYSIDEDAPFQLVPSGVDVDGDPLTWSVIGLPASATFNAATGVIAWTPRNADTGNHSLSLYLSDGQATVQVNFNIFVVNINDAPYLLTIPNQTAQETIALTLDLTPFVGDEDDPPYALIVSATSPHTTQAGNTITIYYPKNSGVAVERVSVRVTDPHGATASGVFVVTVIPAGPDLAIVGVPDIQAVETIPKTLDLAPYLYNVKNWANVTVSTSSLEATTLGTKVTFLYPKGFAQDTESVKLTVREGAQVASWTITVTIVRLGDSILIADLPDLDAAADQETVLELAPYIHNVKTWASVVISVDSAYASLTGTSLHLLYPRSAGVTSDLVTVTVAEGGHASSDSFAVRVRTVGTAFYLEPVPPITVVEGQPFVLFLSSFVKNAEPLDKVQLFALSNYATVDGLTVTFLYPSGSGVQSEQVSLQARFGGQTFQTVLSVTVVSIGGAFTLAGVPNVVVYTGTPYTISIAPYLYNVPGCNVNADGSYPNGCLVLTTSSQNVTVGPGPSLTFLYPRNATITRETVTVTALATSGKTTSSQTITVTVKPLGTRLTLAPVPEQRITEDVPFTLDLAPFILNARGEVTVIAESSYASVEGTQVTFTYPGGIPADEVIITVQSGTQFAQGSVRVLVAARNDPPVLVAPLNNFSVAPGTEVGWDLAASFTDEEDAAGLTFVASDPRVRIDAATKHASFVVPSVGDFRFTITAIDGQDPSLKVTSPEVRVSGTTSPPGGGAGGAVATPTGDVGLPLVVLLVALAAALLARRAGGALFGARAEGPTLRRRE